MSDREREVGKQPDSKPDWSLGHYEEIAPKILSAAAAVVETAAPASGERVLDVGCGSGNATLLVAERGAGATGVDPAPRLLEVARERAAAAGLQATFVEGEAGALPFDDGEFDAVLSVFGAIFAPDPAAAAREMARVTAPAGRIILSAWIPGGALSQVTRCAQEAVERALGRRFQSPPYPWHERDALERLFAPEGFKVSLEERTLAFTAASAREYMEHEVKNHPLWIAGRAVLERRGGADAVLAEGLRILEAGNEDPAGFRVTSRYVIACARRG